jgi:DNA-binding MurR/RpiR family transcriptional regulator
MGLAQLIQEKYHALTKSEKRIAKLLIEKSRTGCVSRQ